MIRLLVVEDQKAQRTTIEDAVKLFNATAEVPFDIEFAENLTVAKTLLSSHIFNAAIVDLKLTGGGGNDQSGNDVLAEIINIRPFPVVVHSGHLGDLDEKFEENLFFKKVEKGSVDLPILLAEIASIHAIGISSVLGPGGVIEGYLSEIFWKHLAKSRDYWASLGALSPESRKKALLRYALLHVQENLELTEAGDFDQYVPAEFYVMEPIKPNLHTGDILQETHEGQTTSYSLVLSPACDVVLRPQNNPPTRNAEFILLVGLIPWNSVEKFKNLQSDTSARNPSRESLQAWLENKKERFHFFPKYKGIGGWFADFQKLNTVSSVECDAGIASGRFKRVASVSSPFTKDLLARFSQYYSRQGAPDFEKEKLYANLFS